MVTQRQHIASSVVGLISVTEIIDSWRGVNLIISETKTIGHRASAHACPQMTNWLKTCYTPSRLGGKKSINSFVNMGPRFKYLPKGYCYLIMLLVFYRMQPFICIANRNRHIGISSHWKFSICKDQQNKIAVGYTWPSIFTSVQAL